MYWQIIISKFVKCVFDYFVITIIKVLDKMKNLVALQKLLDPWQKNKW